MNAKSDDIRKRLERQLARVDDDLGSRADSVEMITSIRKAVARLLDASGGSEAAVRRVLQEQFDAGALRPETFRLVKSMLDRYVSEQIPTESAAPAASDAPSDDAFSSTTVIDKDDLPVTPKAERAQVGSVLRDRFMLQRKIAGGSMGEVYRALDRRLAESGETGQWVAIKVLSPALARNGQALRALQQEAAKGRNLAHPNIVRFIDFDRDDDLYFLVMEWLEGKTLAEMLDSPGGKKVEIDRALEIVRQVGKALEYAHRCGIVHADVKPGNIMILPDGTAKLFDFGVARVWQKAEAAGHNFDPGVLGALTPAYSSMQVITGESPVPSDDVFSLACLLYRLIAGYRVFGPRNAAEACEEGMQPQPLKGLSQQQWEAVRKALSYSRVTRFDTVSEFLDALHANSIERIHAEPRGNVYSKESPDVGKWLVGLTAMAIVGGFVAYELGYLERWLPPAAEEAATVAEPVVDEPVPVPSGEPGITDLPAEVAPEPPIEYAPPASAGEPEAVIIDLPEELASTEPAAPVEEPVPAPTLPPADIEVPLDRSGPERAISVRLREDGGPVTLDLLRLGSLDTPLRVRLEEVDYSGNRSPYRTGQFTVSGNGVTEFPRGRDAARLELVMASDPLREADQSSTLKVRAVDGDASALAHIRVELEDDDQRAFEKLLAPDTVGFAVSQMSAGEQDPAVQVDVVRYNPTDVPLTVDYVVSGITANEGEDYFSPGGSSVVFAPGQRFARLLIPLVQDARYEGDEAFFVELLLPDTTAQADVHRRISIMVRDDDPPPARSATQAVE